MDPTRRHLHSKSSPVCIVKTIPCSSRSEGGPQCRTCTNKAPRLLPRQELRARCSQREEKMTSRSALGPTPAASESQVGTINAQHRARPDTRQSVSMAIFPLSPPGIFQAQRWSGSLEKLPPVEDRKMETGRTAGKRDPGCRPP